MSERATDMVEYVGAPMRECGHSCCLVAVIRVDGDEDAQACYGIDFDGTAKQHARAIAFESMQTNLLPERAVSQFDPAVWRYVDWRWRWGDLA